MDVRCQRDMVFLHEHDALDLAETRGQRNQEFCLSKKHIKGNILEISAYTSRACKSYQGMKHEQFIEVSLNVACHITAELEKIYHDVCGHLEE